LLTRLQRGSLKAIPVPNIGRRETLREVMTVRSSPRPVPRSAWRRYVLWGGGGLFLLLVAAYFLLTSPAFFKSVILRRLGKAIGGEITVEEAVVRPFSSLRVRQLKVRTTSAEPLLQAEEVRLRYSLFSILGGPLKLDEVTVVAPVVQIVENSDGSCNLDPVLKEEAKPASQPEGGGGRSKPPRIYLRNLALNNATFRLIKNLKDGGREVSELTGVNTTLDQLRNGQPGKLTSSSSFKMTRSTNDLLEAHSAGSVEFVLGADLMPRAVKAKIELKVARAEGGLRELAGVHTVFTGDVTPTEVREFSQRFLRGEQLIGEFKVTGPLDLSKKEGRLKFDITGIGRVALNLMGAPFGLDFGATTINSTTDVTLTQGGSIIEADTQFNAGQLSVTQNGQTTPPLDLRLVSRITLNAATQSAILHAFTLDGIENQKPLVRGSLTKPMTFAWGNSAAGNEDSAFELAVTNVDLPAWKSFLGQAIPAGQLSLLLRLVPEHRKNEIKLGATAQIVGLEAHLGPVALTNAIVTLKLNGQIGDFKKFTGNDFRLDLTEQAQPILTLSGSGIYEGGAFSLQSDIAVVMARLIGSGPTAPFSVGMKMEGGFSNQELDLRQVRLVLAPTPRAPANELALAGRLGFAAPGKIKGSLTAAAEKLDLTPLYDVLTVGKNAEAAPSAAIAPAPPSAGNVEPEPIELPLQLSLKANLGELYLRQMAVTNWQTTAKVNGNKIDIDPCRLTLNGAPVNASANLDLGVSGYSYTLSVQMDRVPMGPLADSFSPGTSGEYQGLILADAQIHGAGITGSSLRKNLGGQASLAITNAEIQLLGPKAKKLIVPIAALLGLSEIAEAPVNGVQFQSELGGGNITLNGFTAESAVFRAFTQGVIPIATALTNSPLNLPVEFSLERSLAERLSLLSANTPTNAAYAVLPPFITVRGTIGNPKSDLDRRALGGIVLRSGEGMGKQVGVTIGRKTGGWLKNFGGFLTGRKSDGTNQPVTNAVPGSTR
jgi:uncharacterized protein involved in outer membrane biogenesis